MKQVSKFCADRARAAVDWAMARFDDLRDRIERHRREIRLRLLYGAVSAFGSWGAGLIIAWLMAR